jgi:hypothetical protein
MASFQLIAPLPLVTLDAGCTITLEAIDPDTGAAVTGVTVSAATIYADNSTYNAAPLVRQPLYALEPLV